MKTPISILVGLALGIVLVAGRAGIAADISGGTYVPKPLENKVVIVAAAPGGPKAQKELDEAIATAAKDGWRIASTSAVINGSVVSHYLYFEREKAAQ